jgi:hypothetical protein
VSSRLRHGQDAAALEQDGADHADIDKNGIEVKDLRSCRRQDINGARIRVRMGTLHVNDALVLCGFQFQQVRVNRRRFPSMRVHVKKRGNEHREEKSRYGAAPRQFLQHIKRIGPSLEATAHNHLADDTHAGSSTLLKSFLIICHEGIQQIFQIRPPPAAVTCAF